MRLFRQRNVVRFMSRTYLQIPSLERSITFLLLLLAFWMLKNLKPKLVKRYLHFLVLEDHDNSVPERGLESFYEADILSAIKTLPPTSQEVFRLYAIEGFSHAEIAESLKMSEGTSKWHLSTARQKLRELITRDGEIRQKKTV